LTPFVPLPRYVVSVPPDATMPDAVGADFWTATMTMPALPLLLDPPEPGVVYADPENAPYP
jgi:hypothetical protein